MFSVASYNVLADAYARPDRYPNTPAALLAPGARVHALADAIAGLDADIVCLQEVEPAVFERLAAQLGAIGYAAAFQRKPGGRPDGCATFHRKSTPVTETHEHVYTDGSGAIAQISIASDSDRRVAVANTHLKWSPPGTTVAENAGHRQITELIVMLTDLGEHDARIVCGDFNAEPDSPVAAAIEAAGYAAAHASLDGASTFNATGPARTIDFIFHTAALRAEPTPPLPITDDTPMPSHVHPSDHLAIRSGFDWR